jgi:hypothetical protein
MYVRTSVDGSAEMRYATAGWPGCRQGGGGSSDGHCPAGVARARRGVQARMHICAYVLAGPQRESTPGDRDTGRRHPTCHTSGRCIERQPAAIESGGSRPRRRAHSSGSAWLLLVVPGGRLVGLRGGRLLSAHCRVLLDSPGGAYRGTKLVGDQLAALRIARAARRTSSSVVDQLENDTRRA